MVRPNGVKEAKVIQVIETKAMRGFGTQKAPSKSCNSILGLRRKIFGRGKSR